MDHEDFTMIIQIISELIEINQSMNERIANLETAVTAMIEKEEAK